MDLQEAAATVGAQYMLARLRACRPEWSACGIATTEPQAHPAQSFYGDVESVAAFAAEESHREA